VIEPLNVTLSGPWAVFVLLMLGLPLAVVAFFLERLVRMPPPLVTKGFFRGVQALAVAFIAGTVTFLIFWFSRFNSAAAGVNAGASRPAVSSAPPLPVTSFDDVLNMFLLAGIVIFLVLYAIDRRNEPFGVESHWGGLGDGLSGRRVSISIVHLAIAFVLLGILVTRTPAGRSLLELMRAQHAQASSSSGSSSSTASTENKATAPVPPPK
jgi:hypothetical protein